MSVTGIIGAMDEEIELVKSKANVKSTVNMAGMNFFVCSLDEKEFILVRSGIGKVNAAVCTQLLIDKFHVDAIINTGVAGAVDPVLDIGDIVISRDLVEHDMDATVFGDIVGQVPRMDVYSFRADDRLIEITEKCGVRVSPNRGVRIGRIISGDQFVSDGTKISRLKEEFKALAVEMEGAAIGHTCYLNKVPFVVLRSISDRANQDAQVDFVRFVHEASKISSEIIIDIIRSIS
jgi:5''-methylthioadenosine/S-adenosylhomocysteine nucleosidase